MLGRRVEVLKQKLQGMEKEYQERLTAGVEVVVITRLHCLGVEPGNKAVGWRLVLHTLC